MLNAQRAAELTYWRERVDTAAAFRWTDQLNTYAGAANHLSFARDRLGTRFLMSPTSGNSRGSIPSSTKNGLTTRAEHA